MFKSISKSICKTVNKPFSMHTITVYLLHKILSIFKNLCRKLHFTCRKVIIFSKDFTSYVNMVLVFGMQENFKCMYVCKKKSLDIVHIVTFIYVYICLLFNFINRSV